MKYGKNLTWFLSELSLAEAEQFETGSMEIIGENEQGQEGSTEIEITDLALAAKNRIESLQHALVQICDLASRPSGSSIGVRPDILARAKEALEHQDSNQENITMSQVLESLRTSIQDAEQFGMVRTEDDTVITGAIESEHGVVLTK